MILQVTGAYPFLRRAPIIIYSILHYLFTGDLIKFMHLCHYAKKCEKYIYRSAYLIADGYICVCVYMYTYYTCAYMYRVSRNFFKHYLLCTYSDFANFDALCVCLLKCLKNIWLNRYANVIDFAQYVFIQRHKYNSICICTDLGKREDETKSRN